MVHTWFQLQSFPTCTSAAASSLVSQFLLLPLLSWSEGDHECMIQGMSLLCSEPSIAPQTQRLDCNP